MSEETIRKVLKTFGLTEKETDVYIFLAKHGVLKGGEISKQTKTQKALIYRILKSLQTKGLVESTLEFPARFTAVPFENVIDLNIKAQTRRSRPNSSTEKRTPQLLAEHQKSWTRTTTGKIHSNRRKPKNLPQAFTDDKRNKESAIDCYDDSGFDACRSIRTFRRWFSSSFEIQDQFSFSH